MRQQLGLVLAVATALHGVIAIPAAQGPDTLVRLQGDGNLGAIADEYRGPAAAYGYEGTPESVVPGMIDLAALTADDVVYEPGCGDARILIAALRAGARRGIGVDIDADLAEVAFDRVMAAGFEDKAEIYWGNALKLDMTQSTVVFLFMGEAFNLVMRPLLWQQLPVGARVLSNDFAMGDWAPDRTTRVETPGRTYTLYVWTITPEIKRRAASQPR